MLITNGCHLVTLREWRRKHMSSVHWLLPVNNGEKVSYNMYCPFKRKIQSNTCIRVLIRHR